MKFTREAHIAWVRHIAEDVMNWDLENVIHLYDMLCEIRELLQNTDHDLSAFVDLNRMPSMPHPKHGYTHVIWAVDRKGQALVGECANKTMSICDIMSSKSYRRAEAIFTDIVYWDQGDVAELRDLFTALRATIAVENMTASDIVDPDWVMYVTLPEFSPEYRIWAVDRNDNALVGDDADDIKTFDDIVVDGLLVEATQAAADVMIWNQCDVTSLRSSLQYLDAIVSDDALSSHPAYNRRDAFLDMFSLPSADIPGDLPTHNLWAIDQSGYALVGARADEIVTVETWYKMYGAAG